MTVRPETGKCYKTRDGQKAGPIRRTRYINATCEIDGIGHAWCSDGSYHSGEEHPLDLVAEWTDEPKVWGELTDAEKGALLLAHHRGETIQFIPYDGATWKFCIPQWADNKPYRVKPEPEVKTVSVSCYVSVGAREHVGTIDLIDGKPDLTSLKARADE